MARVMRRGLGGGRLPGPPGRQAGRAAGLPITFQIVEGRIARVAFVRGVIHLNFNRNWRQAFSASLQSADRSMLGPFAGNPKALEGRHVRVRGWIEQPGAPPSSIFPAVDLSR